MLLLCSSCAPQVLVLLSRLHSSRAPQVITLFSRSSRVPQVLPSCPSGARAPLVLPSCSLRAPLVLPSCSRCLRLPLVTAILFCSCPCSFRAHLVFVILSHSPRASPVLLLCSSRARTLLTPLSLHALVLLSYSCSSRTPLVPVLLCSSRTHTPLVLLSHALAPRTRSPLVLLSRSISFSVPHPRIHTPPVLRLCSSCTLHVLRLLSHPRFPRAPLVLLSHSCRAPLTPTLPSCSLHARASLGLLSFSRSSHAHSHAPGHLGTPPS